MKAKMKSKIQGFYQRLKIQNKILLSLYLVILAVGLVSFGLIYYYTYRSSAEDDGRVYQKLVESLCSDIEYLQQDVWDISMYTGSNEEIHSILAESWDANERDSLFWFNEIPVYFIQNMLAIKSQFRTLILYPENGMEPYYISRDSSVHMTDLEQLRGTEFYQNAVEARGDLVWFRMDAGENGIFLKNRSDKIVGMKLIFNMSKSRKLGLLAMGVDVAKYEELCRSNRLFSKESIVVTDGDNHELLSMGELPSNILNEAAKASYGTEELVKVKGYYVFSSQISEGGTRVYYFSPQKIWRKKALSMLTMPLVLTLAMLICMWPLSMFLSKLLAKPLNHLCASMDKFRNGDFQQRVEVSSEDEIGQLALSFNKMAENIQNLIDQNYVMALREKESELNILQAQINPHFLYNVLDSLYWQAVEIENEEMGEEILALSNLFRLVLNQGQDVINVEKELELIRSYLEIQKMRLDKRLNYEIQVEDGILKCKISKLLIQPFVENAVVHGLENSEMGGFVKVCGFQEGNKLIFTVEDNGVGMKQDEADRILEEAGTDPFDARVSHYAISNIQERLRLHYQEGYQLEIISGENSGTLVRLVIPMEEMEVQHGDAL